MQPEKCFQQGKSVGCQTKDQSIVSLVRKKLISRRAAEPYMTDRSALGSL